MKIGGTNLAHQARSLPLDQLREAPWNANQMDLSFLAKLKRSVIRFGLVGALVVRPLGDEFHEVLSGNQRLQVLRDLGWETDVAINLVPQQGKHRYIYFLDPSWREQLKATVLPYPKAIDSSEKHEEAMYEY